MNLRTLKKRSKQALPLLIAHYGLTPGSIFLAQRGENYHGLLIRCHCPKTLKGKRRGCDCQWHPLPGTPMTGEISGHEEPEWEERTLFEDLCGRVSWGDRPKTMTDADWEQAMRITGVTPITDDEIRQMLDQMEK